jgi:hypothetical protein
VPRTRVRAVWTASSARLARELDEFRATLPATPAGRGLLPRRVERFAG